MLSTAKTKAKKMYGIFSHDELVSLYSTKELAKKNLEGLTKEDIVELGLKIQALVFDYKAIF